MQISQRIGSAANPGGRADGNRKQRGSRALTAHSVAAMKLIATLLALAVVLPALAQDQTIKFSKSSGELKLKDFDSKR